MASAPSRTLISSIDALASSTAAAAVVPPPEARSWPEEEVYLYYCVGHAKFSQDMRVINLQMQMYDINGKWVGWQFGTHESDTPLNELLNYPPMPPTPINQPPVPHLPVQEWTKGLWYFADGSGISATGPAQSQLIPLKNGAFHFKVTTGAVITSGVGLYEGCAGIKEATGTAIVPPGLIPGKFPQPGLVFEARTFETFRIVRSAFLAESQPRAQDAGPRERGRKGARAPEE